jgi:hypothetical protein
MYTKTAEEEEAANFHPAMDALETAVRAEYWSTDYTRLVSRLLPGLRCRTFDYPREGAFETGVL